MGESKFMNRDALRRLVESGLMLAIAFVLSFIKLFEMPNSGSITLLSMLPVIIIAYRFGIKWGLFTAGTYGLLQLLAGTNGLKALSISGLISVILLDYLVAFGVLGLAGAFRRVIKNQPASLAAGTIMACFLRFFVHTVSGIIIWAPLYDMYGLVALSYSITYNGIYMGVETVTTTIAAVILAGIFDISSPRLIKRRK